MEQRKSWVVLSLSILLASAVLIYFETLAAAWDGYEVNLRAKGPFGMEESNSRAGKKAILLWKPPPGEEDFWDLLEPRAFDDCPKYDNCFMIRSRGIDEVKKFDAILVHGEGIKREELPVDRGFSQEYVFVSLEAPKRRKDTEDYFNATMTYRLDSDVPWPRYILRDIDTGEVVAPLNTVEWMEPSYDHMRTILDQKFDEKSETAAWIATKCETQASRRELLVEEIEKVMRVDRIGDCAGRCFAEVIEPRYFFYLAFEDTLCEDYVTEEFYVALSHDVIPVVYGGANYALFAPPFSYIDALDFDSPKTLGNYLTDLSQNREEYLRYFWWKRFYTVDASTNWALCNLCELLNEPKDHSPPSDRFSKDECPMQTIMNGNEHATKKTRIRASNYLKTGVGLGERSSRVENRIFPK